MCNNKVSLVCHLQFSRWDHDLIALFNNSQVSMLNMSFSTFFSEGGVIENLTVVLYIIVLLENLYLSVKEKVLPRFAILSTLFIFMLIQRELNLFRHIALIFTTLEDYKTFKHYVHWCFLLPILVLFVKDSRRFYFKKPYFKLAAITFFVILFSQIPDMLKSEENILIAIEESMELFIPICFMLLFRQFRQHWRQTS